MMNTADTRPLMSANSTLRPIPSQEAGATLLLIENSQAMSYIWPHLRDRYLQPLLASFETDQVVPITTLVLENFPVQSERIYAGPWQCNILQNGLYDIRFNYDPGNRLSVGKVSSSADILASTRFQGQPVPRRLIIVAASTPAADITGVDLRPYIGRTPWHQLAQKIAQANIQCHMVVGPNEDMTPLMTLFEEMLRFQNHIEESPLFAMDPTKSLFQLSANATHTILPNAAPFPKHGLPPRRRHEPHREIYSRPSDEGVSAPPPDSEPSTDPPLALVSQLQQVQGLKKKKVYGTKRKRLLPRASPALASPVSITTLPSAGGRVESCSRTKRTARIAGGSSTKSHPTHRQGSRKGPGLSSPKSENLTSPSACHLHPRLPQTAPISNNDMCIPTGRHDVSQLHGGANIVSEPTLLLPHYLSVDINTGMAYSRKTPGQLEGATPISQVTLPPPGSTYPDVKESLQTNDGAHGNVTRLSRDSCFSVPGDEIPFTFAPEYIAATTALFDSEVLPHYPNFAAMSEPIRPTKNLNPLTSSFHLKTDDDSLTPGPSSPAYNTTGTYGVSSHIEDALHSPLVFDDPLNSPLLHRTSYSPGGNYSLVGWTG